MQFSLLVKPKLWPLAVQTVSSSKKYISTYFQKLMSFHLLMTQGSLVDKGYRMVFASICEHASTASFFASTSSDQICLASSEHLDFTVPIHKLHTNRTYKRCKWLKLVSNPCLIFSCFEENCGAGIRTGLCKLGRLPIFTVRFNTLFFFITTFLQERLR